MCLCVAVLNFSIYAHEMKERKCVIIYREYILKLNRLKATFPSLSEKMLKGFKKEEKSLGQPYLYLHCLFQNKDKKNTKHIHATLLTDTVIF